ncbi:hypothetical protein HAHE_25360 [Haloferula helveola]|uniref:Cadherin domain-containing protein n=1 Tax=Haloferula helveola TaxID=490095 RepID=A0ABM7RH21_9BACT|nr:hypothetical protein HAHE_25360 [Haloferula helveola]
MKRSTHCLASILTALLISPIASAFPYDSSLPDVPNNVTSTGGAGRLSTTDIIYNIPISAWPGSLYFDIKGGDGGFAKALASVGSDQTAFGGGGARLTASFTVDPTAANALRPGGELRVIAGNTGGSSTANPKAGGGGGGATGILYRPPVEGAEWEILMIAGGGGGGAASTLVVNTFANAGGSGKTTRDGERLSHSTGSTDGEAGGSWVNEAGGGAGIYSGAAEQQGGNRWSAGGTGGEPHDSGPAGGFGLSGGGAGHTASDDCGGGGGGGFSGGGAGNDDDSGNKRWGGGGGSYIDSRAVSPGLFQSPGTTSPGSIRTIHQNPTSGSLSAPTISLSGNNPMTVYDVFLYQEPGASATDCYGNPLTFSTVTPPELAERTHGTYQVSYSATDQFGRTNTVYRTVTVADTPEISISNQDVLENNRSVGVLSADGADEASVSFSLTTLFDSHWFEIDPETHTLKLVDFPDYESPWDSDRNNRYRCQVLVTDAHGLGRSAILDIDVINDNDNRPTAPTLSNDSVSENSTSVGTLSSTDADGDSVSYVIADGYDGAHFQISNRTLSFITAPDFEAPTDDDSDNVYSVRVLATDGLYSRDTVFSITVQALNDNTPSQPVLSSDEVLENTTAVGSITSTDGDGDSVTLTIDGGADASLFTLSGNALSFASAPDHENPADSGADNSYHIEIRASDGTNSSVSAFVIQVLDENDNTPTVPVLSSTSLPENTTTVGILSATDGDGATVGFEIVGGNDAAVFEINGNQLQFKIAPDHESPGDAGADNVYDVQVRSSDSEYTSSPAAFSIHVLDENEFAPTAPALSATGVDEGATTVGALSATDGDGTTPEFRIIGGADSSQFGLEPDGVTLFFVAAPDAESPADANGDNVYEVQVDAWDGVHSTIAAYAITVGNLNDSDPSVPTLSNTIIQENNRTVGNLAATDPDGDSVTYEITGGVDAALFTIQSNVLSFIADPDFESPQDADADNFHTVQIRATDGVRNSASVTFEIEVRNQNDNAPTQPTLSNTSVDENTTTVGTLLSTDAEGNNITFTITGGDDSHLFTIHADGETLEFLSAPDFENPGDADGDNVYELRMVASDRRFSSPLATLEVTVLDIGESTLVAFRSQYGLAADGSGDDEDWSGNGIANLLYHAYGLGDPRDAIVDRSRLPGFEVGAGTHSLRYVRPVQGVGSGLDYVIRVSDDLDGWEDLEDLDSADQPVSETSDDLGDGYERVTLLFNTQTGMPRRFYTIWIEESVE